MKTLICLAIALCAGCATAPSAPKKSFDAPGLPIAALDFSQCNGALALYVIVDSKHVVRFDPQATTIFSVGPDGKVAEETGPPTPFEAAMHIAEKAGITGNTVAPCDHAPGLPM